MITLDHAPELVRLLEDIFTDEFMQKNTRHESFESFRYSSAVFMNWNAESITYSEALLDGFVRESTDFGSFDEMVRAAVDERKTSETLKAFAEGE